MTPNPQSKLTRDNHETLPHRPFAMGQAWLIVFRDAAGGPITRVATVVSTKGGKVSVKAEELKPGLKAFLTADRASALATSEAFNFGNNKPEAISAVDFWFETGLPIVDPTMRAE